MSTNKHKVGLNLVKRLGPLPFNQFGEVEFENEIKKVVGPSKSYSLIYPSLEYKTGHRAVGGILSKLIIVTPKNPKRVLIGKGLVYDTGGYSLKTGGYMSSMKFDKMGGITALGVLKNKIKYNLPADTAFIFCIASNRIRDNALVPDDIITYQNGIRVEVTNTDAEGRLVLADGLLAAAKYLPKAKEVITIATLDLIHCSIQGLLR